MRSWASGVEFTDNPLGLKMVDAELGAGFRMGRRCSPLPLLLVCYSGQAWLRISTIDPGAQIGAGQAVFVPKGGAVSYVSHRGSRFGHFGIEWLREELAPQSTDPDRVLRRAADPQPFRYAYEGLCHEIINKRIGLVRFDWLQVIDQLARRVIQGHDTASPLAPLLTAMERDLAQPWRLADMARRAGMSERKLRRQFQQEFGESPHACLRRLRLTHAAGLLTESTAKLAVVAEQVGFATPFALTKAFTQYYGKSPREYRKQDAKG